jgi:hypothetical protein
MKIQKKHLAAAFALGFSINANATLTTVDNGLGVYDSNLNITWTQDGNLFQTLANNYASGASAFVTAVINASGGVINDSPNSTDNGGAGVYNLSASDFNTTTGTTDWWGAMAYVHYLNSISYGGSTSWQLPAINPVNGVSLQFPVSFDGSTDRGFNTQTINGTASQLAELYYTELGNIALYNTAGVIQSGYGLNNSAPFTNLVKNFYWSGTEGVVPPSTDPAYVWAFSTANGAQGAAPKTNQYLVEAVAPGLVSSVPVPGAVWLFGSVLAGFGLFGRRKSN